MQNARFGVCQTQVTSPKALQPRALSLEELPKEQVPTERDLYSIDFSTDNLQLPDIPHHMNVIPKSKCYRSQRNHENMSYGSLKNMPQVTQFMEPFYETFFCPLTKNIMEDPVTIESGVTYERKAITEWFEKYNNSAKICCPATGQKTASKGLSTNIALKTTIEEWKERNEAAGIKVARSALSLAISESMVLEALNDLQSICGRKPYNKVQIRNVGMLPLLVKFLEYKDTNVRRATLELLRELAEDDEGKEMVAKVMDISTTIKMLSSDQQPIRHAALLFLLELSRSQSLYEILKNLERSPNNIKRMADNGYLEPLLHHLIEGCEEMKMEMGNYLGEIALGHDSKTYVAERASPALVKMLHTGNALTKKAAFKALEQNLILPPKWKNTCRSWNCKDHVPKSNATIVSVVRETEASYTLIELINNPHEELGIASMKLLVTLSPYLGHTFAERLCKTRGQPESLIQSPAGTNQITEKQAVSANFLADLPHQNLRLNLALLSNDSVPMILQSIHQMQRSGTRTSRSLSAGSSKSKKIQVCPVHRGACSSQNTFCLVDAKAVERLLACLEHENAEVIEAALSALCTLLDDKVDVDKSVSLLSGVDCIQHVLNVVKEHREEGLREKSLWVIERFLMKGGDRSASYISQDRSLPATLFRYTSISTASDLSILMFSGDP
ncbi:putative U-box domain-containing protein 42 [Vitis vinifera]|uniref:RING-type E3 ubiquitin transferase n=1 Tax=Vitis vinifera TaxID=29760 RepID=A0A438CEB0_VITVI|nr:putative U-box domain-containing protein 42 [Vitis vinifera]